MLYYAAMFLFVGLIAGALNWAGVAAVATQSSWTLLLSGIVLLVIALDGATHCADVLTPPQRRCNRVGLADRGLSRTIRDNMKTTSR